MDEPCSQRQKSQTLVVRSTGSPRYMFSRSAGTTPLDLTPSDTPLSTPHGKTEYSPSFTWSSKSWRSPCKSPLTPSQTLATSTQNSVLQILRSTCGSKPFWLGATILLIFLWIINGGHDELYQAQANARDLGRELWIESKMAGYEFVPATHPSIHYMGRWVPSPNRLQMAGTFAGSYFDITLQESTSLFLYLNNIAEDEISTINQTLANTDIKIDHFSFPTEPEKSLTPPVSLIARIDNDEYILLPNVSGIVSICYRTLAAQKRHKIRIILPLAQGQSGHAAELRGLYIDKGGSTIKATGTAPTHDPREQDEADIPPAPGAPGVERQRILQSDSSKATSNLTGAKSNQSEADNADQEPIFHRRKIIEVITDFPGFIAKPSQHHRTGGADGLLAGVMGWEYLLGEMFSVDHVAVAFDGACLVPKCHGGTGYPAGLGDVFFRSGMPQSRHFESSWSFALYRPDVILINLGESDATSYKLHQDLYNKTMWDLTSGFENNFVTLIKSIRRLAYPPAPAWSQDKALRSSTTQTGDVPPAIPVIIMRPLRGHMEHATQNVVKRLRADGDKAVFWLDTTGWLESIDEADHAAAYEDFYFDAEGLSSSATTTQRWRLTERGNQKVAIFLHAHVCRYLADDGEKCPFLPQEEYQGSVYDVQEAHFERYMEDEKEHKLKALFFHNDEIGGLE